MPKPKDQVGKGNLLVVYCSVCESVEKLNRTAKICRWSTSYRCLLLPVFCKGSVQQWCQPALLDMWDLYTYSLKSFKEVQRHVKCILQSMCKTRGWLLLQQTQRYLQFSVLSRGSSRLSLQSKIALVNNLALFACCMYQCWVLVFLSFCSFKLPSVISFCFICTYLCRFRYCKFWRQLLMHQNSYYKDMLLKSHRQS